MEGGRRKSEGGTGLLGGGRGGEGGGMGGNNLCMIHEYEYVVRGGGGDGIWRLGTHYSELFLCLNCNILIN